MIVDDDRTMVKLLQTLLELDGYEVVVVAFGADVLKKANQKPPDVILMDYHLADMSGVEVLQKIRADPGFGQTPVVIASGMDVEAEVKAAGANAFLIKPFDPDILPELFAQLIG